MGCLYTFPPVTTVFPPITLRVHSVYFPAYLENPIAVSSAHPKSWCRLPCVVITPPLPNTGHVATDCCSLCEGRTPTRGKQGLGVEWEQMTVWAGNTARISEPVPISSAVNGLMIFAGDCSVAPLLTPQCNTGAILEGPCTVYGFL